MVDKILTEWQQICPEFQLDAGSLSSSYAFSPFSGTVSSTLNIKGGRYCYSYTSSEGDRVKPTPTCKNSDPTATDSQTSATPTGPPVNNVWLEMLIQLQVDGVNNLRISPSDLQNNLVISKRGLRAWNVTAVQDNMEDKQSNQTDANITVDRFIVEQTLNQTEDLPTFAEGAYRRLPLYPIEAMNYTILAPNETDYEDLQNVRYVSRVYSNNTMMFNQALFDEIRIFDQLIVDFYNNLNGFTSPAALKFQNFSSN